MAPIKGIVHKYDRDNIDTDVILPGPYLKIHDHAELAKHAMEGIDPNFAKKISEGDFLVTGANFGCGSSREHAPIALSSAGIRAVLAPSFARIFYRNAVDGGYLLPIEIERATVNELHDGSSLELDLEGNTITDMQTGKSYPMKPFPALIKKIIECGGILYYKP
ncbi:MAG TPA: 3-isopropylmalate dehydratase small subunit [Nitrososphaeraceae archaeon]|jgi:3-isopropylmalate/(R)-2-methylmalate dehydratase small subunit